MDINKNYIEKLEKLDVDKSWDQFSSVVKKERRIRFLSFGAKIAASVILIISVGYILLLKQGNNVDIEDIASLDNINVPHLLVNDSKIYLNSDTLIKVNGEEIKISNGNIKNVAKDSIHTPVNLTIIVPQKTDYITTLPDGTVVHLNSESKIVYPDKFVGKNRVVYLSGEAFFKVAHNKKRPFILKTDNGRIRVLGTEFNCRTYKDEDDLIATLRTGKIQYLATNNKKVILKPSQQIIFNKKDETTKKLDVNVEEYLAWVDGYFYWDDKPFDIIMKEISRWYGFNVFYQNKNIKLLKFTGRLNKYKSLDEIIKNIERSSDIKITKTNKVLIIKKNN